MARNQEENFGNTVGKHFEKVQLDSGQTGKGLLWHESVLGDTGKHWERNPAEGPGQCWGIEHLLWS